MKRFTLILGLALSLAICGAAQAKVAKLGRGKTVTSNAIGKIGGNSSMQSNACSSGCSECDTAKGICNACQSGYMLHDGVCIKCPEINNGICTYCIGDADYQSCEGADCNVGYWNDTGTCSKCSYAIDGCLECDSTASKCTKCDTANGWRLNGDKCLQDFTLVKKNYSNGQESVFSTTTLSGDQLSQYYDNWPDVNIYDADGGSVTDATTTVVMRCVGGSTGEFWSKSACESNRTHKSTAGYYCAKSGYPSCPYYETMCMVDNCATCNEDGYCQTCDTGYNLDADGQCYGDCPANCTTCSSSDTCTVCDQGYLLQKGKCEPCPENGICSGTASLQCEEGSYFYSAGSNCPSCPTGCAACTSANYCTKCKDGYNLKNGACIANCTSTSDCDAGYICNGSKICEICGSGSNLSVGGCNCPTGKYSDGKGTCNGSKLSSSSGCLWTGATKQAVETYCEGARYCGDGWAHKGYNTEGFKILSDGTYCMIKNQGCCYN